ncbi:MAG: hypothetical protein OXF41_22260 [bacterium]|nr:hypothetical protein [bacterium]
MTVRPGTSDTLADVPEVGSERGQRVVALIRVLKESDPPSPQQVMRQFGWDREMLEQAVEDLGLVVRAVASVLE